jgi:hypothetical protein
MSSTNENDDTLKVFNDLYGDLGDESMGTSEPPQSTERSPTPQLEDKEDPYSYNPYDRTQLPQTEGEVKNAVEELTQKLRLGGLTRRNLLYRKSAQKNGKLLGDQRQCTQANYLLPKC